MQVTKRTVIKRGDTISFFPWPGLTLTGKVVRITHQIGPDYKYYKKKIYVVGTYGIIHCIDKPNLIKRKAEIIKPKKSALRTK